jgi:transmembrane sensor
MQAPNHIADLIFKQLRDELSPEEGTELTAWRQESQENEDIFQKLTDPQHVRKLMQGYYSRKKSWEKILELAPELKPAANTTKIWRKPLSVAATVLIIFGIAAIIGIIAFNYLTQKNKSGSPVAKIITDTLKNDLPPGSNKAILTLSNGQQIVLDNTKEKYDAKKFGNNIDKIDSGNLLYTTGLTGYNESDVFNTLETPRGGQFQLSLPDGSRVWLNAASSIKYPTVFKGNERKVETNGELYFEIVKKAGIPFVVFTRDTKIQVLGTHFNINAYSDEPSTAVTLLEGSVKIIAGANSKIIKPGEQARVFAGIGTANIKLLKNIDVDDVISWKNGRTFFKDADVQSIMRIISRWYDIDVVYQGKIPERSITGGISRNANLSEILKVLEWNKIHFTIEGKKITVTP